MSTRTIVLNGNGPHMKVTSSTGKPIRVLMVSKGNVKTLNIHKATDVRFAA